MVVRITMLKSFSKKVLEDSTEVVQPATVYIFTSQGLQESDMGMNLYNNLPAACAVWDGANKHLLAIHNSSTIDIVKNILEKTIYFSSIKGQEICQCYIDMTYNTINKDGNIKTLLPFADINNCTLQYMFSHSFSKYSVLASIANVLPTSALVDVVFYYSIMMQCVVEHDK